MSLFGRVFLVLWVTVTILLGGTAYVIQRTPALGSDRLREIPLRALQDCGRRALRSTGAASPVRQQESGLCAFGTLVLADGSLSNPRIQLSARDLKQVEGARTTSNVIVLATRKRTVIAFRVDEPGVSGLVYLSTLPLATDVGRMSSFRRMAWLALASGAFCILLTLFFVRPLKQLTETAVRIGEGDFSVRVPAAITGRRDELGRFARAIHEMADRTQLLIRRHKDFLAHASHEFGSPLTRLNLALALARREGGSRLERHHSQIAREADVLSGLTQELLFLARLESGPDSVPEHEAVDVKVVLVEAFADAKAVADENRKTISLSAVSTFHVNGSRTLLRRAIDNVLSNAIRHARVRVVATVTAEGDGAPLTGILRIHDDGTGVPSHLTRKIFEPFYKVATPASNDESGHGLGLAIAAEALHTMGATIAADNGNDGGLIVTLTFHDVVA